MAADPAAAAEMVRISGQRGVPVTVIDGQPIVGFDRRRLDQVLAQASSPRLGAAVADAAQMFARGRCSVEQGAYVGRVSRGSSAASAGLQPGDVIILLDGQHVVDAAGLEVMAKRFADGQAVPIRYLRGDQQIDGVMRLA